MPGGSRQAQEFVALMKLEQAVDDALESDFSKKGAAPKRKLNPLYQNVYMNFEQEGQEGGGKLGRVVFRLYDEYAPQACHNFRSLCEGNNDMDLSFAVSRVHRVVAGQAIYAGDITNGDGSGGTTVFHKGAAFPDESNPLKHDGPGVLSTVSLEPDENRSQFLLTLAAAPKLDGRHVVFGRVESGLEVLEKIGQVPVDGAEGLNPTCRPVDEVLVSECGLVQIIEGEEEEPTEMLDEIESAQMLYSKSKKAKTEQKEARQSVQSAISAGLMKKKKKTKSKGEKKDVVNGASLPVLGL